MFRRYWRSVMTGVFDAILETLVEMVERDATAKHCGILEAQPHLE